MKSRTNSRSNTNYSGGIPGSYNQKKNSYQNQRTEKNSFTADSENYREALKTFYRYANHLPPQRDWMTYKFGLRIRDILDAKKEIKILAVGTGAGGFDIDLVDEIIKCGKERLGEDGYSVQYQVVEPTSSSIESFRNVVKDEKKYHRVQFKWFTGTFDKFCDVFKSKGQEMNKFNFVHFIRCFNYIDSVKTFDRTYSHLLAKNGVMCAMGEDAFWPKVMNFFADHKLERGCFKCSGPKSQNYFLPGWIKLARDRNWRYESYVHGYNFDITPMYDPISTDGNYLLDFAFHEKSARKNLKNHIIEDFFKMLNKGRFERLSTGEDHTVKKMYFPCELGAIMITRD